MYKIGDIIIFTDWLHTNKVGIIKSMDCKSNINLYTLSDKYKVFEFEITRKLHELEVLFYV